MAKEGFGVTSLSVHDTELRPRRITADIHIFSAANGFGVIYFNKSNVQRARIFSELSALLEFIRDKLINKGDD